MTIPPFSDPQSLTLVDVIPPYSDPQSLNFAVPGTEWLLPTATTLVEAEMLGPSSLEGPLI